MRLSSLLYIFSYHQASIESKETRLNFILQNIVLLVV